MAGVGGNSRQRSISFADIDECQASGMLQDVLLDNHVFLGGSSLGKGLNKAARYYMKHVLPFQDPEPSYLRLAGASDLCPNIRMETKPLEDSFYIVDLGVVVSQVYQWRRFFPRVEPFYAVKCNPDPVLVKTLAILGCNFDCASRNEFRLVHQLTFGLQQRERKPEIIFANPCKYKSHVIEAVCHGITLMTFDNVTEIEKCAAISKNIQLVLRIITDDRGSQCRLSSKFGAPRAKWEMLLATAQQHGLQVVGVSFHVGSGCRDSARYIAALQDAREIFDLAHQKYGMEMTLLDIGGGFPGETHSLWNPAEHIDNDNNDSDNIPAEDDNDDDEEDENEKEEGKQKDKTTNNEDDEDDDGRFMFFTEIAQEVNPVLDRLFPPESNVRIIAEPGRYLVAASATLCCSVLSRRNNIIMENQEQAEEINDHEYSQKLNQLTREEETQIVQQHGRGRSRGMSFGKNSNDNDDAIMQAIQEELADYSTLYASQQLTQQEFDVYNDKLDLYKEGYLSATDQLGPPDEQQRQHTLHTVEGMNYQLVTATDNTTTASTTNQDDADATGFLTLAAAGEAAVNGIVVQAVADSAPLQDDFAYYINDGVYGAFNNIMFDHATCRPRVLRTAKKKKNDSSNRDHMSGKRAVESLVDNDDKDNNNNNSSSDESGDITNKKRNLYSCTIFGPTCDSIDVISRSVLLPELNVGDWLYFSNMGAYTMAAATSFNGFTPSEKFYVCSVMPEYFEAMIAGPEAALYNNKEDTFNDDEATDHDREEKKEAY